MKKQNDVTRPKIGIAILLMLALCAVPLAARAQTSNAPSKPSDVEAGYTKAIDKRAADILSLLELNEEAKAKRVHDDIIAQYRALRDWHDANDARLKKASAEDA